MPLNRGIVERYLQDPKGIHTVLCCLWPTPNEKTFLDEIKRFRKELIARFQKEGREVGGPEFATILEDTFEKELGTVEQIDPDALKRLQMLSENFVSLSASSKLYRQYPAAEATEKSMEYAGIAKIFGDLKMYLERKKPKLTAFEKPKLD